VSAASELRELVNRPITVDSALRISSLYSELGNPQAALIWAEQAAHQSVRDSNLKAFSETISLVLKLLEESRRFLSLPILLEMTRVRVYAHPSLLLRRHFWRELMRISGQNGYGGFLMLIRLPLALLGFSDPRGFVKHLRKFLEVRVLANR